jgi:hypothetical protein
MLLLQQQQVLCSSRNVKVLMLNTNAPRTICHSTYCMLSPDDVSLLQAMVTMACVHSTCPLTKPLPLALTRLILVSVSS